MQAPVELRIDEPTHLICLPYAGGSSVVFKEWTAQLPASVRVLAVDFPGHGLRFGEAPIDEMGALVSTLMRELDHVLEGPVAIFGHSMGARVGFELGRQIEEAGKQLVRLFVSACAAPHLRPPEILHDQSFEVLRARLRRFGGTPEAVLNDDDLMELFMPAIRADLKVIECNHVSESAAVACPVTAFVGANDPEVRPESMIAWRSHSTASFRHVNVDGGHFFLGEHGNLIAREILRDLAR